MASFDAQCHPCPDRACAVVDAAFHFMEFSSPRGFEIGVGQALKAAVASSIGSGTRASDVVLFDVCLGSKCDLSSALAARGLRKAGEGNVSVTARVFTSADPFAIRSRMGGADFLTAVRQSISTLTSGKQILPTIGSLAVSMCKEGMFISSGECRACTQCPGGLLKNCTASEDAICNQDSVSMNAIIAAAVAVGSVVALALALLAYFVGRRFRMVAARRKFMQAVQEAEVGVPPTDQIIHYELKGEFHAEEVLGRGGLGIVVRAQRKSGGKSVAIKMVLPSAVVFTEHEERQLIREAKILERISSEHVVQLVGAWGMSKAKDCFWFVMEHLDGEDLRRILKREGPFTDLECIKVARSVLAALKPLHADGCIHRDIKPGNIMRCHPASSCKSTACGEGSSVVYKLIDFGVSVAIKEDHGGEAASTSFLTLDGHARPASGTLMYMSPEMFRDPAKAGYATDIWSLGVTLFELATGGLPFPLREGRSWLESIAEDLDAAAPDVMDRISADRRPTFDHNLARVIARALEKRAADRFGSADEMHEAAYRCLVQRGEACYSGFISYRVASEAPVARILFDVLNHTVTPGGHRVTLFWDRHRLVAGDDWEAGFSSGLLNSLCFFSLLSYGSTAPLAALPEGDDERRALLAQGWEERPVGRERLRGGDTDPEDNFLKECMLACALLERMEAVQNEPSLRGPKEVGRLQLAYPILIGRQHPLGHADHPGMGSFFEVQGGGGRYPERPSPRTSQAVTRFLRDSAGAPREVELAAAQKSVASTLRSLTKLQGCQMWDHPRTLASPDHLGSTAVALSQEQQDLVGAGLAGSLLGLGCAMPAEGFSEVQLRMIKAQILYRLPKFHEVIDRAVSLHNGLNQRSGGTKCYEGTFANRASVATVQRRERGSEERIKIDISPRPSREDPEGLRLGVGSEYAGRRSEHGRSESQHADLGFYSLNPSTPPNVGT
jgi:serine/threonine protein kinase